MQVLFNALEILKSLQLIATIKRNSLFSFCNCNGLIMDCWIHYLWWRWSWCIPQERISIGGSVRQSVGPSVWPSIGMSVTPLRIIAFANYFWPRWDPILNEMIVKRVLRASFATVSFHLSVCPSVSVWHMFSVKSNKHCDTVQTHRCPVMLVAM